VEDPVGFDLLDHAIDIMRVGDVTLVEGNFPLEMVGGVFLASPPSRPMDFN
jgi:hypothetical protein